VERRAETRRAEWKAALQALRQETEACTKEVRQIQELPSAPAAAFSLRPGFNLSKRSQALRMHRRGDAPEQIASALEVSTLLLSRPAQASHALRPAELLAHHTRALSRGSALAGFPARALASYRVQPTTSLGGSFPHW
jgi:hypothetical protein